MNEIFDYAYSYELYAPNKVKKYSIKVIDIDVARLESDNGNSFCVPLYFLESGQIFFKTPKEALRNELKKIDYERAVLIENIQNIDREVEEIQKAIEFF